jgi:hypothetical protein
MVTNIKYEQVLKRCYWSVATYIQVLFNMDVKKITIEMKNKF